MTKLEIEEMVKPMLGNYFRYGKNLVKVESYRSTDKVITIHTDKVNLPVANENFEKEIGKFIPVEMNVTMPSPQVSGALLESSVIGQNAKALGDLIMENIDMVKKDPAYIPQANAINDQLKSLIELGKTQVEMIKTQLMAQKLTL
ncbi:hypothetical protein J3L18_23100 [Mucilaginibacter gossypii]|uniref:hypothetical protein n=1 Tax=Mucilaginibacter gossypii TaxID=551996 RepID=UPI000DCCFC98|nr:MULTISPECIES: hypothetical protein [Mucilaginibacter]QTE36003.1 hypothetical protein J3L18_23100 [Mucilaginibacter gossypii]RAV56677.1 hypothetical protein DIU36_14850 [Mucilaginibacter rubeus]